MLIAKNIENNTMYSMEELHLVLCLFLPAFFFLQEFQHILQLIDLLKFSCTYNFYNLNILQQRMIYHIHTHNYQDSKYIPYHIHLYQLILNINIDIIHYCNVVYYYEHLLLIYIYTYMFHAILYVLFYQFSILD